jgi:hypothetical protein
MNRDIQKARDLRARAVRRYRERVMRETLAGERPWNTIPARNAKRQAKRQEADDVYGSYYRWVRDESGEPCALVLGHGGHRCGYYGDRRKMEAHHLKTVGSGGKDAANLVRICPLAHDLIHQHGANYARDEHGLDLIGTARAMHAYYVREVVPVIHDRSEGVS